MLTRTVVQVMAVLDEQIVVTQAMQPGAPNAPMAHGQSWDFWVQHGLA